MIDIQLTRYTFWKDHFRYFVRADGVLGPEPQAPGGSDGKATHRRQHGAGHDITDVADAVDKLLDRSVGAEEYVIRADVASSVNWLNLTPTSPFSADFLARATGSPLGGISVLDPGTRQ